MVRLCLTITVTAVVATLCVPTACFVTTVVRHNNNNNKHYSFARCAYKNVKGLKKVSLQDVVSNSKRDADRAAAMAPPPSEKTRRTRRRTDRPQQTYVYASQRKRQADAGVDGGHANLEEARRLGWNPAYQYGDPVLGAEPRIVAELQLLDHGDANATNTNSKAYLIEKPVGWSIMAMAAGGNNSNNNNNKKKEALQKKKEEAAAAKQEKKNKKRKLSDDEEDMDIDMDDVLALLTPEERAELEAEEGIVGTANKSTTTTMTTPLSNSGPASFAVTPRPSVLAWLKDYCAEQGRPIRGGKYWRAVAGASSVDDSGLVLLCPKDRTGDLHLEHTRYCCVVGTGNKLGSSSAKKKDKTTQQRLLAPPSFSVLAKQRRENLSTVSVTYGDGVLSTCTDVVDAVQEQFQDGVRGDPTTDPFDLRATRRLVHCDSLSVSSLTQSGDSQSVTLGYNNNNDNEDSKNTKVEYDTVENNDDDDEYYLENTDDDDDYDFSTQDDNDDSNDDASQQPRSPAVPPPLLPDDMALLSKQKGAGTNNRLFDQGSFVGRSALRQDDRTTVYREINGVADGHPGWTVDRYDKWLFVRHDDGGDKSTPPLGPLPSIHDGRTLGVYYHPTAADNRNNDDKPRLLEGQAAPDVLEIQEHGVRYAVRLSERLSTGLFPDQRPQRAWLANHCGPNTRVLNCFAHAGAYSVAAASAGASTVSLDLDKRWLDRIEGQMALNGIDGEEFRERHDCIYGDCFDWLQRLVKRGEKFDIVILDPPSTSVGGKKKKRWSVKNDMAELVALAAPLVKEGGLLWTTNNCSTLRSNKFANMCRKGFEMAAASSDGDAVAGVSTAKLERIVPMPVDFPSFGSQPVTNLVWRVR